MKKSEHLIKRSQVNSKLKDWQDKEKIAIEIIKTTGHLRFKDSVEIVLFRQNIFASSVTKIIADHNKAKEYFNVDIKLEDSFKLLQIIDNIQNLVPSKIDIGKLNVDWMNQSYNYKGMMEFVYDKLGEFISEKPSGLEPRDVILYGMGRIGRLLARIIISQTGNGQQLRLKAIVVRQKLENKYDEVKKRISLLETDTVHGDFPINYEIAADGSYVMVNGNKIHFIFAGKPQDIDYTDYGIQNAIVMDNTGMWREKSKLANHLRPGVEQVILTAPGQNIPNIVFGINHNTLNTKNDKIYSAASCTTNAIVPLLKVMDDNFKIKKGHIETIHAYTSDQNLLDNFHKKPRRGRGAATNMVLTTTGAAKAVSKVLPHLNGILTGNAVRVPTPNVSLAIIAVTLDKKVTIEKVNEVVKNAAYNSDLFEQIHFSNSTEFVSSQAVGMTTTSVYDAPSTVVSHDGKTVTIYAWYDNEFGYSSQVIRLAKYGAKVRRKVYL